eukprot:8333172-Ditylum_brightwellii.AAC.1
MAGTKRQILEDTRPIPHLEGAYVSHLRECMAHINATIRTTTEWNIPLQRENNSYIMDQFMDSPHIEPEEVKLPNYCRLLLEITTVAEITTLDGKRIREKIFYPQRIPMKPRHDLDKGTWLRQNRPNLETWKTWQKLLVKTICNEYGVLHSPLGKWMTVT